MEEKEKREGGGGTMSCTAKAFSLARKYFVINSCSMYQLSRVVGRCIGVDIIGIDIIGIDKLNIMPWHCRE